MQHLNLRLEKTQHTSIEAALDFANATLPRCVHQIIERDTMKYAAPVVIIWGFDSYPTYRYWYEKRGMPVPDVQTFLGS